VTTSSQQPSFSITSNDVGVIAQDVSTVIDNITIDMSTAYTYPVDTITLTSTILSSDEYNISWGTTEWVDGFPGWERIQDMCNEYPGLKIAFEKFKTTYKLVKDDYDTPTHKRKTP
jgi:hypothetical protein